MIKLLSLSIIFMVLICASGKIPSLTLSGKYETSPVEPQLKNMKTQLTFGENHLRFKECNIFNCDFTQRSNKIEISVCIMTEMACLDENFEWYFQKNIQKFDRVKYNQGYFYLYSSKEEVAPLRIKKQEK